MALFSPITAQDYQVSREGTEIVQAEVTVPKFEFQYSDNFEFYKPCFQDWTYTNIFGKELASLRPELAASIWETVRMKCRYILAAAIGWKGNEDDHALPLHIRASRFRDINMIPPPFPPEDYLAYNFLKIPGDQKEIEAWIDKWQQTGHQLSAWIAKAKNNSIMYEDTTWKWPEDPREDAYNLIYKDRSAYSDLEERHALADMYGPPHGGNYGEGTRMQAKLLSLIRANTKPPAEAQAHTLGARVECGNKRRSRDYSPADSSRDGLASNKTSRSLCYPEDYDVEKPQNSQVIKWQPSIAQMLQEQLNRGFPFFLPPSIAQQNFPESSPCTSTIQQPRQLTTPVSSTASTKGSEEEKMYV
jgi:hypothetical protein